MLRRPGGRHMYQVGVPMGCLFTLNDEADFFVEFYIRRSVGFEVARGLLLFEMLDVAMHQRRADALSLSIGSHADGSQMNMRLLGIEMAPSREPLDDLWNCFTEGFNRVVTAIGISSGAGRQLGEALKWM